jgi:hypothetical protein
LTRHLSDTDAEPDVGPGHTRPVVGPNELIPQPAVTAVGLWGAGRLGHLPGLVLVASADDGTGPGESATAGQRTEDIDHCV